MSEFWDNFWVGANESLDQNKQIASDYALKKLAARIQQRQTDANHLWESVQNDKKRKQDMEDWQTKQDMQNQQAQQEADTKRAMDMEAETYKQKQEIDESAAAIDFRIARLGKDAEALKDYPRTKAGIAAVEAELKNIEAERKYKRERADAIADRDFKAQGNSSIQDMPEVRKPEQARILAQDIIGKEEGGLPKRVEEMQSDQYSDPAELAQAQGDLAAIRSNRPGGLPALTDSLRLGQGQYATPEQLNQQVSPEQAANVTQELATLKAQLAELLNKLGVGK